MATRKRIYLHKTGALDEAKKEVIEMGLSENECKEKGGEIYDLADTNRRVCILPKEKVKEKEKKQKAVLID